MFFLPKRKVKCFLVKCLVWRRLIFACFCLAGGGFRGILGEFLRVMWGFGLFADFNFGIEEGKPVMCSYFVGLFGVNYILFGF